MTTSSRLTVPEVMGAWERCLSQAPTRRALILLEAASPEVPLEALERMSIGRRDACLLTLRERLFGPQLHCLASCPACGERLEMSFMTSDIRAPVEDESPGEMALDMDGWSLRFRLPDALDLEALQGTVIENRAAQLLKRCVLAWSPAGEPASPTVLPEAVHAALLDRMEAADPQANVELAASCARCGHAWLAPFDIESYLWDELHVWAQRMLRDVHRLATAYGWREPDILAMSAWKRQFYLDLVEG